MLLSDNTKRVIDLIEMFDDLKDIDKIRLAIYLLENKNFNVDFNARDMIILLKQVLSILDSNYTKVITNFSKYKHLLFFSDKYLELTEKEKNISLLKWYLIFMKIILKIKLWMKKLIKVCQFMIIAIH